MHELHVCRCVNYFRVCLFVCFFYIQSFQDWICCPRTDPCMCVCVCVCLSVCLSVVISNLHNFGPILLKLGPHSLNKNLRWHFSQNFKILLRWRHNGFFAVFKCGTLTSLIFFNFIQTWWIFSSTHSSVLDGNLAFSAYIFYPIWPPKITEKPLNSKFEKNKKQNDDNYWVGSADEEYDHI